MSIHCRALVLSDGITDSNVIVRQIIDGRVDCGIGLVLGELALASCQVIALMLSWIFRLYLAQLHAHLLAYPSHCFMAIELM